MSSPEQQQCPVGFAGPNCEVPAEICGNGELVCLHGTKCFRDSSAASSYRCACPENSQSSNSTSETGSCQHYQTEFCIPSAGHVEYGWGMAVAAFCVNDGKCQDIIVGDQVFPSCICPPQFTGPHCEFLVLASSENSTGLSTTTNNESKPARHGGWIVLISFVSLVILGFLFFVARQIRRLANRRDGDAINLQSFREEDVAMSPNGSMLFPAFSPSDSFSTSNRSRSTRSRGRRIT